MPCRADSLAFGVLAAVFWRDGSIRRSYASHPLAFKTSLAILALAIPIFIKWLFNPYSLAMGLFGYSWLALFFTGVLLFCLLEPDGWWSSFLRLTFLRDGQIVLLHLPDSPGNTSPRPSYASSRAP
jgi:hypothetical protein